jgi:hypothetical protein
MSDETTTQHWPLNESQRRALTIVLAGIEQNLQRVAEAAQHPPRDGLLTRYTEPLPPGLALAEPLQQLRARIRQLAADLQLPVHEDSITRSLVAALLLDEIGLEEVEPSRLRGYGAVDAGTAEYLNRELPQLRALLTALTGQLHGKQR